MADYTLTRYLKLKIADDLSADAKYNLSRLDALGATFINDVNETLNIRSAADITIEPEAPAVGGGPSNGTVTIGTASHFVNVLANSLSFTIRSALSLPSGTSGGNPTYLNLSSGSNTNRSLVLNVTPATSTLTVADSGTIVTKDGNGDFSAGVITASFNGPLTGNVTGNLTGNVVGNVTGNVTGSLFGNATTATTAANLSGTNLTGDVTNSGNTTTVVTVGGQFANHVATATSLALAATDANTASTIVKRDASGNFVAGTISATTINAASVVASSLIGSLSTSNLTGTVAIANGGTGATTASGARASLGVTAANILPSYTGNALATLRVNAGATDVEWVLGAGQGTVTGVTASSPLSVTGNPSVAPNITIPAATSLASGYLTSADWTTFNSREPAISSGTTGQYWRGDKSWQTLDKSAVGLSNADNTSDVNKPISSATQTALDAKYDASNPSAFVNASGAKAASVVNSYAGSETDQAASVSAMKAYVTSQGAGSTAYTWSTADGVTKAITHSLNKTTISVTVYDENGEDILVDTVDRTSNNAVTLTSSAAPTGNWTVVIRP
jgi:hypothetical protein